MNMITGRDILTSSGKYLERDDYATDDVRKNAFDLAERVDRLLLSFGHKRIVTSGFRPAHVNAATPGAAEHSLHIVGAAVDLEDDDRELALFCGYDLNWFKTFGLWMENPRWTRKKNGSKWNAWVHLQLIPPPSGSRVFVPNNNPPPTE